MSLNRPQRIRACLDHAKQTLDGWNEPSERLDCIWHLLVECMETEKAIGRPGPKISKKHGLEYHHTASEIHGTEVAILGDNIQHRPDLRHTATREALDRHSEVMTWFRWIYRHNRHTGKRNCRCRVCMVILLAKGLSYRRVADIHKVSHQTIARRKKAALQRIERGIIRVASI